MFKFLSALFLSAGSVVAAGAETSMNFDSENVRPFLEELKSANPHLVMNDVLVAIDSALKNMAVEDTRVFTLNKARDLRLEIFLDDFEAPDLYFFGSEAVIKTIDEALNSFADARGL